MFPSTTYHRRYYNDWYDRPTPTSMNMLDDPFFFRSSVSSLPYYLRPRRFSTLDSGDSNNTHTENNTNESTTASTKSIGGHDNGNMVKYPHAADEKTGSAEMANQKDKFVVSVDVSHFAPDEIQVKVADSMLVIEACHEEKLDEHGGFVTRSFKRRYELPPDANPQGVTSDLNSDGILTVMAPKIHVAPPKERVIPVQFSTTNPPKSILKKK